MGQWGFWLPRRKCLLVVVLVFSDMNGTWKGDSCRQTLEVHFEFSFRCWKYWLRSIHSDHFIGASLVRENTKLMVRL
ncbi:hypothetical protein L873DRAFT_194819 [Choiromyces venosus 120613-1]|uniref:Secreted protein n=1 Tax=Choiromyces venosus 120613-1 TaxID=1336337 RepID=A0A3N4J540_9PEZI|nr:hypothetical protein L873DRAFT_194819 [Choiromyces venosus 120613-1]